MEAMAFVSVPSLGILTSKDQASNKCGGCLWSKKITLGSIWKPRDGFFTPPSYGHTLGTLDSLLGPDCRKLEIAVLRSRGATGSTASFWSSFESAEVTG